MSWQSKLAELISTKQFTQQGAIVASLKEAGYQLNQASISRELKRLGARKINGVYQMSNQMNFGAPIFSLQITSHGCLMILKTRPAFASVLAHRIDISMLDGVMGTLAGDDTVFVALKENTPLTEIKEFLGWID